MSVAEAEAEAVTVAGTWLQAGMTESSSVLASAAPVVVAMVFAAVLEVVVAADAEGKTERSAAIQHIGAEGVVVSIEMLPVVLVCQVGLMLENVGS